MALFSYDQPLKLAPNTFSMEFPGFSVNDILRPEQAPGYRSPETT
ncbi:hypothetical protein [Armatimonas sp.]